jgi:AAA+ superfamily predicted ATPase
MLEYYNGILFLTTNRPGVLDEAVKSRVHLNLHYNFLTEDQVVAIFKINIQRLREIEDQAAKEKPYRWCWTMEWATDS